MNDDQHAEGLQRTTLDPEEDVVVLTMWVPPIECEGCGGRVDTFARFNANTEARCGGCGSTWEFTDQQGDP